MAAVKEMAWKGIKTDANNFGSISKPPMAKYGFGDKELSPKIFAPRNKSYE
jgi:hypothetical protein